MKHNVNEIIAGGRAGGGGGVRTMLGQCNELDCFRYLVLADYDPLSGRELGLRQSEVVELLKTGCAGWWFVRLVRAPYSQGWAPTTYLQQLEEM